MGAVHPVQGPKGIRGGVVPESVALSAYEVYKFLYGEQKAMITGNCRGGFGSGELIAFLYAKSFPKNEWLKRVDEAFEGMRDV